MPFDMPNEVIPVSLLNRLARETLEQRFPLMWVSGEISNLTRAASGHVYFSLKDDQALVRCVMFRQRAQLVPWRLENGQQVEAHALVSLYEARGDFQLNIEGLRQAGLGRLFEAFLKLKAKLTAEGLFDDTAKRSPPRFPRAIGIISSAQAAALADILTALRRRAPHVPVVIYPTLVQGEDAPAQIVKALQTAARRAEVDVLLLARGGGSIEDLWAFNNEAVARAIAASPMAVISGVGHETDFTIADFAADLRAATPTAAAELASAGWFAARLEAQELQRRLAESLRRSLEERMQRLDSLSRRLTHPAERLAAHRQTLEESRLRLATAMGRQMHQRQSRLAALAPHLARCRPQIAPHRARMDLLAQRLRHAFANGLAGHRNALARIGASLDALNPDATLARGYAIVRDTSGRIVTDAGALAPGDALRLRLAKGEVGVQVTAASNKPRTSS